MVKENFSISLFPKHLVNIALNEDFKDSKHLQNTMSSKKTVRLCFLIIVSLIIVFYYVYLMPYWFNEEYFSYNVFSPSFNIGHIFDLEFKYVIRNECTNDSDIRAILIVTSYAGQVEGRSALRRAYPKEELAKLGIYRVFLLGQLKPGTSEVTQHAIIHENNRYNDIVQGNFLEGYRNLTYKHVMGLAWAVTECNALYVLKQDDDIVVDMYTLMELVDNRMNVSYDLFGNVFRPWRVIRNPMNKWFVTKEEFNADVYPHYVSGWLYVAKFDAVLKLLNAMQNENYFWIDDVFVTGILASKARIRFEMMNEYFVTNWRYFECCLRDKVQCGFVVGPNGGDFNLVVEAQKHFKMCHESGCRKYPSGKTVKETCVVVLKPVEFGNGTAELDIVKL